MITSRIDAITQIPPERMAGRLAAPRSVKIELTSLCNFRCGFCANGLRLKERGEMSREFFEEIVPELWESGVEELGLFYIGESMLCTWLPQAIAYAKEVGFPYVFLTTNGALATPAKVKACMAAGLDSLKWSYNNADAAQFTCITGVNSGWLAKTKDNIKAAHLIREQCGYPTRLYASSIQYNGEQGARMAEAIDEIRPYVDEHYWLPLYSFGSLADAQEAQLGYRPIAGNQGRIGALRQPIPCWSLFTEGHITFDGKLSACCFDAGDLWEMGDLTRMRFMDAWNSDAFIALREAHLRRDVAGTACDRCVAYR